MITGPLDRYIQHLQAVANEYLDQKDTKMADTPAKRILAGVASKLADSKPSMLADSFYLAHPDIALKRIRDLEAERAITRQGVCLRCGNPCTCQGLPDEDI